MEKQQYIDRARQEVSTMGKNFKQAKKGASGDS